MYALMVVTSNFPDGDAGAVRDELFSNIYRALGFEVVLIGRGQQKKEGLYKGIKYRNIYTEANTFLEHVKRYLHNVRDYLESINAVIQEMGIPCLIHINDLPKRVVDYIIHISISHNIIILHDSVEWYSPCEFKAGRFDKAYILKNRLNRRVIRNPIRVIGISSYLTEYFYSRNIQVARIPVIMDVEEVVKVSTNQSNKIKLIYAGDPNGKDYLKDMVNGIEILSDFEKKKLEFNIYGVTEQQIMEMTGRSKLSDCIHCYGRVTRSNVKENLLKSDFSVLMRPSEERYAKAGFPTKVVEAMTYGVAMICNISSDLEIYLEDMRNAVIVKGYNETAFSEAVRRVLCMSNTDIVNIKKQARKTAEQFFDYRLYIETIRKLIEGN